MLRCTTVSRLCVPPFARSRRPESLLAFRTLHLSAVCRKSRRGPSTILRPEQSVVQVGVRNLPGFPANASNTKRKELPKFKPAGIGARSGYKVAAFARELPVYTTTFARAGGVAIIKMTMVMLIIGTFALVVIPHVVTSQEEATAEDWLRLGLIGVCGMVPFLLYTIVSAPFVVKISIVVPEYARASKELLFRYIQRLPDNPTVIIQTIGMLPMRKTTQMRLNDLRFTKSDWLSLTNLQAVGYRHPTGWLSRTFAPYYNLGRTKFHVDPKYDHFRAAVEDRTPLPGLWPEVSRYIRNNSKT